MSAYTSDILLRVLGDLDRQAFKVDDTQHLSPGVRQGIAEIADALPGEASSTALHDRVDVLRAEGVFSAPRAWSVHAMIDLYPARADHPAAAQSIRALAVALDAERDPAEERLGREAVERLQGALCFLDGDVEKALAHYISAMAWRPATTNLANVLAALVRLGRCEEAREAFDAMSRACPPDIASGLLSRIEQDPDLAPLALPSRRFEEAA